MLQLILQFLVEIALLFQKLRTDQLKRRVNRIRYRVQLIFLWRLLRAPRVRRVSNGQGRFSMVVPLSLRAILCQRIMAPLRFVLEIFRVWQVVQWHLAVVVFVI